MSVMIAIEKLDAINKEQKLNLEQLHEQFVDLKADPRFTGMPMNDIEDLFSAYLKTWISTNKGIIETLHKEQKSEVSDLKSTRKLFSTKYHLI